MTKLQCGTISFHLPFSFLTCNALCSVVQRPAKRNTAVTFITHHRFGRHPERLSPFLPLYSGILAAFIPSNLASKQYDVDPRLHSYTDSDLAHPVTGRLWCDAVVAEVKKVAGLGQLGCFPVPSACRTTCFLQANAHTSVELLL